MDVWEDPDEFARRVRAARHYLDPNQDEFGARVGISSRRVRDYEKPEKSPLVTAPQRKRWAEKLVDLGAPPEFFGLASPSQLRAVEARLDEADDLLGALVDAMAALWTGAGDQLDVPDFGREMTRLVARHPRAQHNG